MLNKEKNKHTKKENLMNIKLDSTQQMALKKLLKCGIYKELHKREFLSDTQLNNLIERNS